MRKIDFLFRFALCLSALLGVNALLFALPASAGASDPRIVTPDSAALDRNNNKISDLLELDLGLSPSGPADFFITSIPNLPTRPDEPIEVLIDLSAPPEASDLEKILGQGGSILGKWQDLVYALAVRLPRAEIANLIQESERVVWVEGIPRSRSALFRAVNHIRVREVWKGGGGLGTGYTGSGQVVAVLDTGIDDSHPDLAGRIKYWEDVVGDPDHPENPPAVDPFDKNGHGTHVSGIVAGSGEAVGSENVPVSFPGFFPSQEGSGYIEPIPVLTASVRSLQARLWAEKVRGSYYFTVEDENQNRIMDEKITADGTEIKSVDLQGDGVIYAIFSTDDLDPVQSAGSFYVGEVDIPYDSYNDGFSLMRGVAPGAEIAAYKILDNEGNGNAIYFVQALESITSQAESLGIVAVNASLTFDTLSATIDTAVENLVEGGIAFITAAGTDRDVNIGSPGTAPLSIAVGAMTLEDKLTDYSSPGGNRKPIKPDVVAPGGGGQDLSYIFSADANDTDSSEDTSKKVQFFSDRFPNDYQGKIGTSQASGFVSGLVALLAEARGNWIHGTPEAPKWAKQLILMTASEIKQGEIDAYVPPLGRAVSPKDNREGYGRINPDAALEAATLTYGMGNPAQAYLDAKLGGKRVWARALELDRANEYTFTLQNPTQADFDLYLYEGAPDENGEPLIAAYSARDGYEDEEISGFRPEQSGKFYLAVKRVSGFGQFTLTSELQVYKSPACGCGILPVSQGDREPEGLVLLAGLAFFLGPILIIKLRARRKEQGAGSKGQVKAQR
ncbi:MAG: S8 family serine peptidase [Proteobacteria bacterium]|nr:S8 family serine peptidase [Pseudomonadota bacterium]